MVGGQNAGGMKSLVGLDISIVYMNLTEGDAAIFKGLTHQVFY